MRLPRGLSVVRACASRALERSGFASGALELGSDWHVRETALGLPLRGLPGEGQPRYVGDYFASQPMARSREAMAPAIETATRIDVMKLSASDSYCLMKKRSKSRHKGGRFAPRNEA